MSADPATVPTPPQPPAKEPADALTIATRSTSAARALHAANVIDIDAGLALLEQSLEGPTFDAPAAVAQLKQLKPILFRAPAPPRQAPSTTMSAHAQDDPRHELTQAAERAAATGDRNAVLTYMRAKRLFA